MTLLSVISCGSDESSADNDPEEEMCYTCEGANGATICDDDVTFRITFDTGVIKIYTYEQTEVADDFESLKDFIQEEGCDENLSVLLGIEGGMREVVVEEVEETTEEGGEETPDFTKCVTCAAYASDIGGMVEEQEICELDGNAWVDGVDQGVEYRVILASRRVFTTCQ